MEASVSGGASVYNEDFQSHEESEVGALVARKKRSQGRSSASSSPKNEKSKPSKLSIENKKV